MEVGERFSFIISEDEGEHGHHNGSYVYYMELEKLDEGFLQRFSSSADFEYCPVYGYFQRCHGCREEEYCEGYNIISDEEGLKILKEYNQI